jgi:hypothetical protein
MWKQEKPAKFPNSVKFGDPSIAELGMDTKTMLLGNCGQLPLERDPTRRKSLSRAYC